MSKRTGMLAVAAGLALASMPAFAQKAARKPSTPPKAASKDPSFTDDMEKLTSAVGLTEDQQKKLGELRTARDAAIVKWDEANQKRIDTVQEQIKKGGGKNARARAQLEQQLKGLQTARRTFLASHERQMFAVLTREQRGKWNAPILAEPVLKEFAKIKLDEEQTQKVRQLCEVRGQGVAAPVDPAQHEGTIKALRQQVFSSVLTPAQRNELAGPPKAAPKAKPRNRTGK
ncbi:MAG TPA: Spy/CpxP family protein refolding chaperone [Phycisphaerae bacterium]|nr:Spy/CpxP family protein refolding chaperone [Phycisphaerae bacterium]